jgi:hypothetical protein
MTLYDPSTHEPLLVAWFYELKQDDVEFRNLFAKPLRRLGPLLHWAEFQVKIMYELGDDGMIAMAAWVTPLMSAGEFGAWIRKDYRGSVSSVRFIRKCYKTCFETFPTLVGITKQPDLHELHLALGYRYLGEVEHLFDHEAARVYVLSREAFYGRKFQEHEHVVIEQPLRGRTRAVRKVGAAAVQGTEQPDQPSTENGRSERGDTGGEHQPRRRKKRLFDFLAKHPVGTSPQ